MKIIAEVQQKSLTLDTYVKGAQTGFTLTYSTMNKMDPYSYIFISYPLTAGFSISGTIQDIACSVSVNEIPFAHVCKLDRIKREIVI